jgi:hypothetical protein
MFEEANINQQLEFKK